MRKTLDPNASQVPNESSRGENASARDEASTRSNIPRMPDLNETPNANRARGEDEGEESGGGGSLKRSKTNDFLAKASGVDRPYGKGGTKGDEQSVSKRVGVIRSVTEGMRKMYNSHKGSGKTSDSHFIHESNSRHSKSFGRTLQQSHSEHGSHSEQDKSSRKTEKSHSEHGNQKKTLNPPPVPPKNNYREPSDQPPSLPPPPPPKHRDQQKHSRATKHDTHHRPSEASVHGQDKLPGPPVIVIG